MDVPPPAGGPHYPACSASPNPLVGACTPGVLSETLSVEGALRELEYRLDVLKLDSVVLFSNARGIYLGDACVRPLFAELERHAVVVFVHPTASPDAAARTLGLPDSLIDFTTDTTRAVAQLHYGDTFARTPSVSYIFSHVGGTIPYLATRFSIVDAMRVIPGAEERGDALRRLYWDTACPGTPLIYRCFGPWLA